MKRKCPYAGIDSQFYSLPRNLGCIVTEHQAAVDFHPQVLFDSSNHTINDMGRKWLNGKSREVAITAIWKQFISWPPFLLHYPIGDYSNTRSSGGLPQIQHQSVLPGPLTVDPCPASRSWVHLHPSAQRVFAALWRSVKRTPRSRYFIQKIFLWATSFEWVKWGYMAIMN